MKEKYLKNIPKLYALKVLAGLTFANALLVPFFVGKGLDQTDIMLLQTIFSVAVVVLEVPTGYVADTYGRAVSLRLGAAVVGAGFLWYAFAESFFAFALLEILVAVGFTLLSGADEAMMYDSLLAEGQEKKFRSMYARMQTIMFAGMTVGAPIGALYAEFVGINWLFFTEGLLTLGGFLIAMTLSEPPMEKQDSVGRHPLRDIRQVLRYSLRGHPELPRLLLLGSVLAATTYFGFWFAPAYFAEAGIAIVYYGVITGIRSGLKTVVSHYHEKIAGRFSDRRFLQLSGLVTIVAYLILSLLISPWLILVFALFDIVQSAHMPVVSHLIHDRTDSHIRAQVMSVLSLMRRAAYGLLGPVFALFIDRDVQLGYFVCGAVFAVLLVLLFWRRK